MRGLKAFLPLLLLAVNIGAIPVPEPQSIALVSAHAAVARGADSASFEKREVRGDLETTEAETEATTEEPSETEAAAGESEGGAPENEEEGAEEVSEKDDVTTTTEGAGDLQDRYGVVEEDVNTEEGEKAEEEEAEEEKPVEEPEPEEKPVEEPVVEPETEKPEEEKEEGEYGHGGEEERQEGVDGIPTVGEEDGVRDLSSDDGPLFTFGGHPMEGPAPWPWGPLGPLDHPGAGIPDHSVQQVGNELWAPRKVVVPIYLIRFDHRYLPWAGSPYQGL